MKTKVVVFDFDGTLSKRGDKINSWAKVWAALNDEETDYKYYKMFKNGEIDDEQWDKLVEKRFFELGLKEKMLDGIAEKIQLIPGLDDTFKILKNNHIKIYVLSGGVKNLIVTALKPYEELITNIEGRWFSFQNGNFAGFDDMDKRLDEKHNYINYLKEKHGIKGEEVLFVGNGANDQTVYLSGARTLCINPDDADYKNKKYWDFYIENCENLTEIIPFLEKEKQREDLQK